MRRSFQGEIYRNIMAPLLVRLTFALGVAANEGDVEFQRAAVDMLEDVAAFPDDCSIDLLGEIRENDWIKDAELVGRLKALVGQFPLTDRAPVRVGHVRAVRLAAHDAFSGTSRATKCSPDSNSQLAGHG